ncbi:MAG: LptF/LptG family permease [Paludibacteraceae bacterium]|nr:LptF/LptG family permease [Paludibacteraceae bacterium]
MAGLKHIDRYTLSKFLKTFFATFFGAVFIFLMQFSIRYVDDLVGKGVGIGVLGEFFFYAALSLVPMALPLSLLIGSLMTFSNLGEKLELLAMKAAGISLFRVMAPLIIVVSMISIGSFFFANNVLPKSQVKMWTLLFSIRQKSPELDIPEGSFYDGIDGQQIYVERKRGELMLNVLIYDYSQGFNNARILIADTATIRMTDDKKNLVLNLYSGECFESSQDDSKQHSTKDVIPYRHESFSHKQILIAFDANFNMLSSDFLETQYVSKKIDQLQETVDSLNRSVETLRQREIKNARFVTYYTGVSDSFRVSETPTVTAHVPHLHPDSVFAGLSHNAKLLVTNRTRQEVTQTRTLVEQRYYDAEWMLSEMRRNGIERLKRFTLAFACFIFLFIGAPLGAIIRKGGMGWPLVSSVLLFITYYIIDNTGYKMAREGIWSLEAGMWFSSCILLPIGIVLTYLAATEKKLSDYKFFRDLFGFFGNVREALKFKRRKKTTELA